MFIQKHSLCEQEPGKSGDGGAKLIELAAENERLKNHHQKLLDETKAAKVAFKTLEAKFAGIDPEQISKMMKTLDSSEEAKMLAEGKIDELVAKRTEKVQLAYEALKESSVNEISAANERGDKYKNRYNSEKISTSLRQAAEKSNAFPEAIDDIIGRANNIFSIGEDGKVEARSKEGELVTVGSKALSPIIFVEQLKEKAPHFWPNSEGHNASGKRFGKNQKNPFKKGDSYNLTEQAKLMNTNPELANQLKAAAG